MTARHPFGSGKPTPCRHTPPAGGDCHPDDELDDGETCLQCHWCRQWYRMFYDREQNHTYHNGGWCSEECRDADNAPEMT